jgi:hypothetical protein
MAEIDPIQYGQLIAKVDALETQVSSMQSDIKTLLEMANKSKGGFWVGMAIASVLSGIVGSLAHGMFNRG